MKKRLYVDFHVLQTVPPSCINRDDTGSPKTAMYGGVLRARVSSQAWKHAMRKDFAENTPLDVGKRTKKAAELVKEQILALDSELDADKLAKKALENTGIKSDDKGTKASALHEHCAGKSAGSAGCGRQHRQKRIPKGSESGSLDGYGAVWPHGGR